MKRKLSLSLNVIIIIMTLFIYNCSQESSYTTVRINIGPKSTIRYQKIHLIDKFLRLFSTAAVAQVPSEITSLTIYVTGEGLTALKYEYSIESTIITLYIPSGSGRIFTVDGNAGNVPFYRGVSQPVDLDPDARVDLYISMRPYNRGTIYVSNYGSDQVSVIDGNTNEVSSTISVGNGPAGLAVNKTTGFVYVSNDIDGSVSVINSSTNTVVASPDTGINNTYSDPLFIIDVNENTNKIYVTQGYEDGLISVIDGNDYSLSTIDSGDSYSFGVCINSVTNKIYVSIWNPPVVFDGSDDSYIADVNGGSWDEARDICVNSVTNKIYAIADYSTAGSVFVVNGSTDTYSTSITVQNNPYGIEANPATNKIYVSNYSSGTVSVIDGSTDTINTTITVGTNPIGIAVNSLTNTIYVANWGSQSVSVINGITDTVTTTITVGSNPAFLDVLQ